jgi:hypothetical protein
MDGNEQGDYGDDQGTRVGAPDQERTPAKHSDASPDRAKRQTGAGAEAVAGTDTPVDDHDTEHRSGYGGAGGKPVSSSNDRG